MWLKFKLSPLIQGALQKFCTSLGIIAIFVHFNKFFQGSKVSERTIMILNTKIAFTAWKKVSDYYLRPTDLNMPCLPTWDSLPGL